MAVLSDDPLSFRCVSDRSPQPIIALQGPDHIVRYANPAFCALVGADCARLLGSSFCEAVPETNANQCIAMLDRVFASGVAEGLAEQAHGADVSNPVCWTYLAWVAPGPADASSAPSPGIVVHITDSTEIAAFRHRSVAMNEELLLSSIRQHELIAEAEAMNIELRIREQRERDLRESAEAADRSKDVFLATLSHELRSPLNAVLGWAVMLRSNSHTSDEDLAEGFAVIERNARAQSKLIEDVLDVARITSGKFLIDTTALDVALVVRAAVDAVRTTADANAISIELSATGSGVEGHWISGDAPRLQQAILNLLANAIKFTPKGGQVTVRVESGLGLAGLDVPAVRITVRDNGIGIDPAFLPYVFQRFKQAGEGTTRAYGGLGLGLSIVRHVVEAHGGTATAHSDGAGRGSTFTIELPALQAAEVPPPQSIDPAISVLPRLDGVRVLIVDDEEDARELAGRALRAVGALVSLAASAKEAYLLAIGGSNAPHVIVSDIGMPHEDGCSLLRRIRASKSHSELPAVAMTAFAAPEDKRVALSAGYQAYLSKPVDPRELVRVVAGIAGRTT